MKNTEGAQLWSQLLQIYIGNWTKVLRGVNFWNSLRLIEI